MEIIYLLLITLLAATVQSAIGFGFGLIAVPVFLWLLDSSQAIQIAMILIFFISCIDAYKLRRSASIALLKSLSTGLLIGLPLGVLVFNYVDLSILKALIASVIIFSSGHNLWRLISAGQSGCSDEASLKPLQTLTIGGISGLMTTSLAMPGPVVMMYFVQKELDKTLIRATILTYFVVAYGGGIIFQMSFVGISSATWLSGVVLVPAGLLGAVIGHKVAHKINQKVFKFVVLIILVLTAITMMWQLF